MRNDLPCLTHRAGKKQKESQAQNFVGWQKKELPHTASGGVDGRKLVTTTRVTNTYTVLVH